MNTIARSSSPASLVADQRRSTRLFQAVPLKVSGQNKTGNSISELTSALAVNCHGCVYSSRYEYVAGAWVTLHILTQELDGRSQSVRAQVKFVALPRNPRELYQVGVELEAPANVWGIQSPPQDWLRLSSNEITGTETTAGPASEVDPRRDLAQRGDLYRRSPVAAITHSTSSASDRGKGTQTLSADLLQQALGEMLQEAATKAVEAALSSRLNLSVNRAARAIENFSQAAARRMEEHCAQTRENFETSVGRDLLAKMQSDITAAEEQLREQIDTALGKTQHAAELLERTATEIPLRVAETQAALQFSADELEAHFSMRLRETVDRAARDCREETARVSQERISSWNETMTAVTDGAAARLQERSADADVRLETAVKKSIENVQAMAEGQIAQVASKFHDSAESCLASFAAEARAEWDAHQRACREEVARVTQQEIEEFRQRLDAILHSAVAGAISAANEHSRILLDSLLRGTVEHLQQTLTVKASG